MFLKALNGKSRRKTFYCLLFVLMISLAGMVLLSNNAATSSKEADNRIRLIVRGDDIGFCHAANMGFEKAYKQGILTTAEVMVPPAWFNEGAEILRQNPGLDVGIHLVLTSEWDLYKWKPVLPVTEVPTLVDKDGYFFPRTEPGEPFPPNSSFLEAKPKISEVEKEMRAQIELAMEKIPNITHLSCHMGTGRATPQLKAIVDKLCREYKLILRYSVGAIRIDNLSSGTAKEKEKALVKILKKLTPGLWMFGCHPAMDTPEIRAIRNKKEPNIAAERAAVTEALTSKKVKKIIEERKIELVSYRDIKREL